jgi:hypothetical protein
MVRPELEKSRSSTSYYLKFLVLSFQPKGGPQPTGKIGGRHSPKEIFPLDDSVYKRDRMIKLLGSTKGNRTHDRNGFIQKSAVSIENDKTRSPEFPWRRSDVHDPERWFQNRGIIRWDKGSPSDTAGRKVTEFDKSMDCSSRPTALLAFFDNGRKGQNRTFARNIESGAPVFFNPDT